MQRMQAPWRAVARWIVWATLLTAVVVAAGSSLRERSASAAPGDAARRGSGKIALATMSGARGPLVLTADNGGYAGDFAITNVGSEPLAISRVAIRGDDEDFRTPAHVSARLEGGAATATLAPGASKKVTVAWMPERDPRMKQAFGHVVVTSTDEEAGEVAMGFRGQAPRPLGLVSEHPLSWLVFLPLAGVLLALVLHLAGAREGRAMRWIALAVTVLECALALWLCHAFVADVTRGDGNDGFQFVERVVWIPSLGVEYFVGVDGASVSMLALVALLSLLGVVASFRVEHQVKGYFAMYLLVVAAAVGVFVALDLALFFVCWGLMLAPMYFLIGGWGGSRREHAALKFFVLAFAGSTLILLAIVALHGASDPTFLASGVRATKSFAIPELMRVAFSAKQATIAGLPFVKVVWVALFLGVAIMLPMFPLHTWFADAYAAAPSPVAALLVGVLANAAPYALLRVGFGILPEATRWAAGGVVAFGVVNVVYGALCAMAQRELARLAAYAAMSQMGFCLIGLGSLAPQGIAGCFVHMFNHGSIAAMVALLLGVLESRAGIRDLGPRGGLARTMPAFAFFIAIAFVASMGLPGLSGFWGEALALMGVFPVRPVLALVAMAGLVVTAAYLVWALQRLLFGTPSDAKPSDIDAREIATIAPLAVLIVVLGLWPVPLFALASGSVRDMSALLSAPGAEPIAAGQHRAFGSRLARRENLLAPEASPVFQAAP